MQPFLTKMSAHFRGYASKDPAKSIYAHHDEDYPAKLEHRLYREKIVDYEDNDYHHHHHHRDDYDDVEDDDKYPQRKPARNGQPQRISRKDDNDVDYLYRRSREKFASWDIKDLDDQQRRKASGRNKSHREIDDAEVEDIFVNGESSSSSPTRRSSRNGTSSEGRRSSSVGRRRESIDRQNGKSRGRRTSEPWSEEDDEDQEMKSGKNGNNRYENFGSLKKKNEKNAGLNLGFRAIVDKFRRNGDEKDKKESGLAKSKKQEYVDDDWRYDNGNSNGHKERKTPPDKFEAYPKESKTEKNHRIREHEYDQERRFRRRSPEDEDEYHHRKDGHHDGDRSKRRSYAFEASPEEFDVRIQKYERARRDDTDLHRRNSFNDRADTSHRRHSSRDRNGSEVTRKSSLRNKENSKHGDSPKGKPPKPRISERHSRPLTPPRDHQPVEVIRNIDDTSRDPSKKTFSMKEWYESNRQFAAKYLKDHSKIKELSTSDAKDEFVFDSPKESRGHFEIENVYDRREIRRESFEDNNDDDDDDEPKRGYVKIQDDRRKESKDNRRRRHHRRESLEDDDEEEEENEDTPRRSSESYARSFVMPSRKIWNYRDGV